MPEPFFPPLTPLLLHQKWGFHIYVCLCRNSSSSVVTFSMPLCKPKMKFFVFTFATSCLFSVLSLFSAEETAMLMLETGGLCFEKIQDWQSAPDGELVCCFFCGCRPCGHIPATLHMCGVIKRTSPHAIWSFFSVKNLFNSVLHLWVFIRVVILIEIAQALFCFLFPSLHWVSPDTPKMFSEAALDKCKRY